MESRLIVAALALLAAACGGGTDSGRDSTAAVAIPSVDSAPVRPSDGATVVFLGTSLTAGLGVDREQAYPAIIQHLADSAGLHLTIVNAGNSGETSAGALRRLDWVVQSAPALLVIETGANDGLRGQDPDSTERTIQAIIDSVRSRMPSTRIALVQMEAMPNLGRRYVERFHAIYPTLARTNGVTLVPFLLNGVAGVDSLNQADGIHPTPRGHRIVAETVWRALRPLFEEIGGGRAAGR